MKPHERRRIDQYNQVNRAVRARYAKGVFQWQINKSRLTTTSPGPPRFSPAETKKAVREVEGFNAKLAVIITSGVGTMACAYVFAMLALVSLPDAIKAGRPQMISWIAQTFLQLVLLSIIMVGQRVQSAASDARAEKEFADTEVILDRLDTKTAGGLADVLVAIKELGSKRDGAN